MHNDKFAKGSESQRLISPAIQIPAAIKEKSTRIKVTNLLNWVRCDFQRGEFLNALWGHSKTKTMSFCIPVRFLKSWMKWFTFSSLKLGGLESRCHHQQGVTVLCSTWFFSPTLLATSPEVKIRRVEMHVTSGVGKSSGKVHPVNILHFLGHLSCVIATPAATAAGGILRKYANK